MLEFRFFSSAPFAGASAIGVLAFIALGGYLFVNTLYLQDVRHLSAFHAGLYVLPLGLVNVITAPIAGRIVASRGTRLPLLIAGAALALSPLPLLGLSPTTSPAALILSYVLFGLGSGFVNPPVTHTAISGMPPAQAGVAAAITSTSRSVGQVLGIAAIGAIVGAGATRTLGPAFAQASHTAWWIVAGPRRRDDRAGRHDHLRLGAPHCGQHRRPARAGGRARVLRAIARSQARSVRQTT